MKRIDFDRIRKSFEVEGYQLLTLAADYKNNRQKLDYICSEGHKHFITYDSWSAGRRCVVCSGRYSNNIFKIRDAFEKENYQLLTTEYRNAHQKLEFICPNGHKHSMEWRAWQDGQRCGVCNLKVVTYQDIKNSFERERYQLLSQEYENNTQRLNFICPRGHRYYITWGSWVLGRRCALCAGNQVLKIEYVRSYFQECGYD
jgi:transcription initiation factor IIE alpha subunit